MPHQTAQGELGWQGAIAHGDLDLWGEEGEGTPGPDEGIVVPGRAGDFGDGRSGPERCRPAMCISEGTQEHGVGLRICVADNQLRLDAATAYSKWRRNSEDVRREVLGRELDRFCQCSRIEVERDLPRRNDAAGEETTHEVLLVLPECLCEVPSSLDAIRIGPQIRCRQEPMLGCRPIDVTGDGACDEHLKLAAGQAPACGIWPAGDQPSRDVVGMALAVLEAVGRGQPVAGLVPELARERGGLGFGRPSTLPPGSSLQLLLDAGPEAVVDDGRMPPGPGLLLVPDLPAIDGVCEDLVDLTGREMPTTLFPDDYEVGYAKPPKHTQWKKGQSGNKSGKSKKAESLRARARKLAGEEIAVTLNGCQAVITRDEAMLRTISQKAIQGDIRAARFYSELIGTGEEYEEGAVPCFKVTEDDLEVMKSHASWLELISNAEAELDCGNADEASQDEGGDNADAF